jgi:hypothetical protein
VPERQQPAATGEQPNRKKKKRFFNKKKNGPGADAPKGNAGNQG